MARSLEALIGPVQEEQEETLVQPMSAVAQVHPDGPQEQGVKQGLPGSQGI